MPAPAYIGRGTRALMQMKRAYTNETYRGCRCWLGTASASATPQGSSSPSDTPSPARRVHRSIRGRACSRQAPQSQAATGCWPGTPLGRRRRPGSSCWRGTRRRRSQRILPRAVHNEQREHVLVVILLSCQPTQSRRLQEGSGPFAGSQERSVELNFRCLPACTLRVRKSAGCMGKAPHTQRGELHAQSNESLPTALPPARCLLGHLLASTSERKISRVVYGHYRAGENVQQQIQGIERVGTSFFLPIAQGIQQTAEPLIS